MKELPLHTKVFMVLCNPFFLLYHLFYWFYEIPDMAENWWVFPTLITLITTHLFIGALWFIILNVKLNRD